jgi:hypothetical protein
MANHVAEIGLVKDGPSEIGLRENRSLKAGSIENGSLEIGPSRLCKWRGAPPRYG